MCSVPEIDKTNFDEIWYQISTLKVAGKLCTCLKIYIPLMHAAFMYLEQFLVKWLFIEIRGKYHVII
jgi:hypothetical protein